MILRGPYNKILQNPAQFLFRGPCMILHTSLTEDLVQMPCLRGARVKALVGGSWEALVSRSYLVRSASAAGPFMTILRDSLRSPSMKILVKVFYMRL